MNLLHMTMSMMVTLLATTMVFMNSPMNSTLSLCAMLLLSTCLLFLAHVEFLSYMFMMVYVGGMALLFLFVIVMLNLKVDYNKNSTSFSLLSGPTLVFMLALKIQSLLALNIQTGSLQPDKMQQILKTHYGFSNDILGFGLVLYTHFFFYFLMAGVILLTAMLGVLVLSLNDKKD